VVGRLDEAGHAWAADKARKMLEPIRMSLEMARSHPAIVRAFLDDGPDP
jgi:hypothetical protein